MSDTDLKIHCEAQPSPRTREEWEDSPLLPEPQDLSKPFDSSTYECTSPQHAMSKIASTTQSPFLQSPSAKQADVNLEPLFQEAARQGGDEVGQIKYLQNRYRQNIHKEERARLALAIVTAATHRGDMPLLAQLYALRASQLAPQLHTQDSIKTLGQRENHDEAIAALRHRLKADPNSLHLKTKLLKRLTSEHDYSKARPLAEEVLRAAGNHSESATERQSALITTANFFEAVNERERNAPIYFEILDINPKHYLAHWKLANTILPREDHPQRQKILELLEQANQSYLRDEHKKALDIAAAILDLDPYEPLAHFLFAVSQQNLRPPRKILAELDSPQEQKRLVAELEKLLATAEMGSPSRPGRPSDLIVDWARLPPLQRATIARSLLGFGRLLPRAMEQGHLVHLMMPGSPLTGINPKHHHQETLRGQPGRTFYGLRGLYEAGQVYVGIERIQSVSVGAYDTLAHEFGHVVHAMINDAQHREKLGRALSADDLFLANMGREFHTAYQKAIQKKDERPYDAYAETNFMEYFAQGMMGYMSPGKGGARAEKLFKRNPSFFTLAKKLVDRFEGFPRDLEFLVRPEPSGYGGRLSLMQLNTFRKKTSDPILQQQADQLFEYIESTLDDPDLHNAQSSASRLLGQLKELQLVAAGHRNIASLELPKNNIARMNRGLLLTQSRRELEALKYIRQTLLNPHTVQYIDHLQKDLSAMQEQLRASSLDDLSAIRERLTQIHGVLAQPQAWHIADQSEAEFIDVILNWGRSATLGPAEEFAKASLERIADALNPPSSSLNAPMPPLISGITPYLDGAIRHPQIRKFAALAKNKNYTEAEELLRGLHSQADEKREDTRFVRELATAFSAALHQAEKRGHWKWWEVLLSVLSGGLAALFIDVLRKRPARQFQRLLKTESAEAYRRQRHLDRGRNFAIAQGQNLSNLLLECDWQAVDKAAAEALREAQDWPTEKSFESALKFTLLGIREAVHRQEVPEPSPNSDLSNLSDDEKKVVAQALIEFPQDSPKASPYFGIAQHRHWLEFHIAQSSGEKSDGPRQAVRAELQQKLDELPLWPPTQFLESLGSAIQESDIGTLATAIHAPTV